MARFHGGGYWEAYGLGLARSLDGEHELWGHGGDGLGSATELWHLPRDKRDRRGHIERRFDRH